MSVTIRKFERADRDGVVALWHAVLPDSQPHNEPNRVIDQKLAVDDLLFVAALDGRVVGTAMAGYDGHRGWIYSVAVYPELQRQGIASQLMETALGALRGRGCGKVNLQVRAGNEAVIAFYGTLGFSVEGRVSMGVRLD